MSLKEFKTESKKILDLMVNSIYTNKDIFLRELISNASDSIDKVYYKTLSDENLEFNKSDYKIIIGRDKDKKQIYVEDTGIGMTSEELESNLGVIAKSGSLEFKETNKIDENFDIIGQFGVGFYSSFMVAKKVTVLSRAFKQNEVYKWVCEGVDGYTIEKVDLEMHVGTKIIIDLKDDNEDFKYSEYLEEYKLRELIKKYSDFIRYPIIMDVTKTKPKDDDSKEFEQYTEKETINSMVPIWRKNKNELEEEDYNNFYQEKHFGFDKPLKYIHLKADGVVRFNSILYIPSSMPFNFFSKDFKKGLSLYSNGVLIMDKCEDLLPDYYSFVEGVVDSEDLSLNISRETLQKSRQLSIIAKKIKDKITSELKLMLKNDREEYNKFYDLFSRSIKLGVYNNFGQDKDYLKDLLMFKSSNDNKYTTLSEYTSRMKEGQDKIYYMTGDSIEKIQNLPQIEVLNKKDYEILYFTDPIDEFTIKILQNYEEKEFASASDTDIDIDCENEESLAKKEESKDMLKKAKEILKDKVSDVIISSRLVNSPVCLTSRGNLSIEMEKVLDQMPEENKLKANKVLEINPNNKIFENLNNLYKKDEAKFEKLLNVIYSQAKLIEGLTIDNPVDLTNDIIDLII